MNIKIKIQEEDPVLREFADACADSLCHYSTALVHNPIPQTPEPGTLYFPAANTMDMVFMLLVLENIGLDVVNAAPVFYSTEYAGADDLLLHADVLGAPAVISYETACSLPIAALKEYIGRLPDQLTDELVHVGKQIERGEHTLDFQWGIGYFGSTTVRYRFHEQLAEAMTRLQGSLIQDIYAEDERRKKEQDDFVQRFRLIDWEQFQMPAAAADNTTSPVIILLSKEKFLAALVTRPDSSESTVCWRWDLGFGRINKPARFDLVEYKTQKLLATGVILIDQEEESCLAECETIFDLQAMLSLSESDMVLLVYELGK